jgi:hypothetical protein
MNLLKSSHWFVRNRPEDKWGCAPFTIWMLRLSGSTSYVKSFWIPLCEDGKLRSIIFERTSHVRSATRSAESSVAETGNSARRSLGSPVLHLLSARKIAGWIGPARHLCESKRTLVQSPRKAPTRRGMGSALATGLPDFGSCLYRPTSVGEAGRRLDPKRAACCRRNRFPGTFELSISSGTTASG